MAASLCSDREGTRSRLQTGAEAWVSAAIRTRIRITRTCARAERTMASLIASGFSRSSRRKKHHTLGLRCDSRRRRLQTPLRIEFDFLHRRAHNFAGSPLRRGVSNHSEVQHPLRRSDTHSALVRTQVHGKRLSCPTIGRHKHFVSPHLLAESSLDCAGRFETQECMIRDDGSAIGRWSVCILWLALHTARAPPGCLCHPGCLVLDSHRFRIDRLLSGHAF